MAVNPVLTISILCSGREETKKCLDSLETLRKQVSSELILVDTGCSGEIKKSLEVRADVFVPFRWCDDFSKARNAGLEKAKGEWFLYIDDDEYFIDTGSIEDFFLSGEYESYGYAVYTVRNFFDEKREEYQDTSVARLYSLSGNGRFAGAVHEDFTPVTGPVKVLPSIAEHTGYIYKTPEEERKHTERNITLLEKAISEEKSDAEDMMRLRAHLAQEYFVQKNYKKLSTFCTESLYRFAEKEGNETNRHRGCFYCGEILARMLLEDWEAAFLTYEKAVSDKRNTGYCRAYLMTQGAELFRKKGMEEEAEKCCRKYLELWDYYRERPEQRFEEQTFFVINAFYDEVKSRMYSYQICLDLRKEKTTSLQNYFDLFGWDQDVVYMVEDFMPSLVKAMAEFPFDEIFVHVTDILANKPGMNNFWEEIEKINDEKGAVQLIAILSKATGDFGDKAGAKLCEMLKAEQENDWERFSVALKEIVRICPYLSNILKCYAEIFAKQRAEYSETKRQGIDNRKDQRTEKCEGDKISAEMQVLAAKIKAQIPILLRQGMQQEALQILRQLKVFVSNDEELLELEKNILNELQDIHIS